MASAPATDALVRVRGLSFSYGPRRIFENLSLDIRRGAITAIIGPSGIGKSTLLALLGGQLQPLPARSSSTASTCTRSRAATCSSCVSAWA